MTSCLTELLDHSDGLIPRRLCVSYVPPVDGSSQLQAPSVQEGTSLEVVGVHRLYCALAEVSSLGGARSSSSRSGQLESVNIPLSIGQQVVRLDKPEFIFPTIRDVISHRHCLKRIRASYSSRKGPTSESNISVGDVLEILHLDGDDHLIVCLKGKEVRLHLSHRGDFEVVPDKKTYDLEEVIHKHLCPQWVAFSQEKDMKLALRRYRGFQREMKLNHMFEQRVLICRVLGSDTKQTHQFVCFPLKYRMCTEEPRFTIPQDSDYIELATVDPNWGTLHDKIEAVNMDCSSMMKPDRLQPDSSSRTDHPVRPPRPKSKLSQTESVAPLGNLENYPEIKEDHVFITKNSPEPCAESSPSSEPTEAITQTQARRSSPVKRPKGPAPRPPSTQKSSEELHSHDSEITISVIDGRSLSHTASRTTLSEAEGSVQAELPSAHPCVEPQQKSRTSSVPPRPVPPQVLAKPNMIGASSNNESSPTSRPVSQPPPRPPKIIPNIQRSSFIRDSVDITTMKTLMSEVTRSPSPGPGQPPGYLNQPKDDDSHTNVDPGAPEPLQSVIQTAKKESRDDYLYADVFQYPSEHESRTNTSAETRPFSSPPGYILMTVEKEGTTKQGEAENESIMPVCLTAGNELSSPRSTVSTSKYSDSSRGRSPRPSLPPRPRKPPASPQRDPRNHKTLSVDDTYIIASTSPSRPPRPISPSATSCKARLEVTLPQRPRTLGAGLGSPSRPSSSCSDTSSTEVPLDPSARLEPVDGAIDMDLCDAAHVRDIPRSWADVSVKGLMKILSLLKLEKVATICEDNEVDGQMFQVLTEDDLKKEPFCLSGLSLKKIIRARDEGWRPKLE